MTISLEERVARAPAEILTDMQLEGLFEAGLHNDARSSYSVEYVRILVSEVRSARAAIAAVREYDTSPMHFAELCQDNADLRSSAASIRESERAACEAIAMEMMRDCDVDEFVGSSTEACEGIVNRIAARKGKGEGR